jgi:2-methylcitrate dehydratase PrpD
MVGITTEVRTESLEEPLGPTATLARLIAGGRSADLPGDVLHQAKRCLVDYLGVTLAGQRERSADALLEYVDTVGGSTQATIIGGTTRTSAPLAALVNGQAAHVLDFDDTYFSSETTLHGTAPVYSAALAVGEWQRASGLDVLNAFVLGFEVATRIALALGPAHYDAGWHVTGTAGRFGAAAAAAKLLGLDEIQCAMALGLVATQAGGMKAVYGSMAKALHAARAAHDGVAAALLVQRGFTCVTDAIEAELGFLHLYTPRARPERLLTWSGGRYAVLDDGFKPYPCGSLIHAAIDGVLDATTAVDFAPEDVDRVDAHVNAYTASVTAKPDPATGLDAKFSVQHCIAVVLARRRGVRSEDFTDEVARDGSVRRLRDRVRAIGEPDIEKDQASVSVFLRDGRVLSADVAHARGTAARPVDDEALSEKFRSLTEPSLGAGAPRLLSRAWSVDSLADVSGLPRLAQPRMPNRAASSTPGR